MKSFDLGAVTAYALAVKNGFKGTVDEWLDSLKGEPFTYEDFTPEQLESLRGFGVPIPTAADVGKVPLVSPDGKGYVLGEGGKQPDWNQNDSTQMDFIKHRPFYEEVTPSVEITWDGDTSNIDTVMGMSYKVSDVVLSPDEVNGSTIRFVLNGEESEVIAVKGENLLEDVGDGYSSWYVKNEGVAIASFVSEPATLPNGNVITPGTYFLWLDNYYGKTGHVMSLKTLPTTTIKQIDPKYIKDMYYEEGMEVEFLPEISPAFEESANAFILDGALGLVDGETYIVNWNGTEYNSKAVDITDYMGAPYKVIVLGDLGSAGVPGFDVTGEPFLVQDVPDEGGCMVVAFDGSTTLTLSIRHDQTTIKKIDNKYLNLDWLPVITKEPAALANEVAIEILSDSTDIPGVDGEAIIKAGSASVVWNGELYRCNVITKTADVLGTLMTLTWIGNAVEMGFAGGVFGSDTGEPFAFILRSEAEGVSASGCQLSSATHKGKTVTFSIMCEVDAYNKLPKEYLPDTVATKTDIEAAGMKMVGVFTVPTADVAAGTTENGTTRVTVTDTTALAQMSAICDYIKKNARPCFIKLQNNMVVSISPLAVGYSVSDGSVSYSTRATTIDGGIINHEFGFDVDDVFINSEQFAQMMALLPTTFTVYSL